MNSNWVIKGYKRVLNGLQPTMKRNQKTRQLICGAFLLYFMMIIHVTDLLFFLLSRRQNEANQGNKKIKIKNLKGYKFTNLQV